MLARQSLSGEPIARIQAAAHPPRAVPVARLQGQTRRRYTGETPPPPAPRRVRVSLLEPSHELREGRCGLVRMRGAAAQLLHELAEEARGRPAVEDEVVVAPGTERLVRREAHRRHPHQRRAREVEVPLSVARHPRLEPPIDVALLAPVLFLERDLDVPSHPPQGPRGGLDDLGAQLVVSRDHRLPRRAHRADVHRLVELEHQLLEVRAAAAIDQAMGQETLLHRRQRIEVLEARYPRRHLRDLRDRELRQREVRRRVDALFRLLTVRDEPPQLLEVRARERVDPLGVALGA